MHVQFGSTALHHAASDGHYNAVYTLLKQRPNHLIRNEVSKFCIVDNSKDS